MSASTYDVFHDDRLGVYQSKINTKYAVNKTR
jgi:hypothetical protein